jgi:hypothetical protein
MVDLLIFPIVPIQDPIIVSNYLNFDDRQYNNFRKFPQRAEPDWSKSSPEELTEEFNKQVGNNLADLTQLVWQCKYVEKAYTNTKNTTEATQDNSVLNLNIPPIVTHYNDDSVTSNRTFTYPGPTGEFEIWNRIESYHTEGSEYGATFPVYREYDLDFRGSLEACATFWNRWRGYLDTLLADGIVMSQTNFDVIPYVVLVIYDGVYYGHIYTWISSKDPNICFAQRIRGRVDAPFLSSAERLSNISKYLFEGIRMFALQRGCDQISVIQPIGNMVEILKSMGFSKSKMPRSIIGMSPAGSSMPERDYDTKVYQRLALKIPFLDPRSINLTIIG